MEFQFTSSLIFQYPVLLLFLFLSFRFLKIYRGSRPNRSNPSLPPGPWKLPILGSMHHMIGSHPHHKLRDLARKYGPLMHLQLGEIPTIVVSSPKVAIEVMKTHDITFASRPELFAAKIITYNCTDIAFAPYGEYWREIRKICTLELLSSKRVQSFREIREEEASKLIRWLASNSGSPVNLTKHLFEMTYRITARAAFGKECSAQEVFIEKLQECIVLVGGFEIADLFPSWTFLHFISGTRPKLERILQVTDSILENIIAEHLEATGRKTGGGDVSEDLIDTLLKFKQNSDQGFSLTTNNIKAVIFDIFSGGGDTSSTTVDWAMAEMIRKPEILKKAQDEVRRVFDRDGEAREDGLPKLKYLKLVIKETLRLHPVLALLLPRECRETCTLDGFDIPKKTRVIVNAWAIGRDPEYWDEPETFNPERFLNSSIDYKGNNFEYIPFGAGRRMCPGINFGVANVENHLATLLYHFDWKLPEGMNEENLDMAELFGAAVRRKQDLYLIPTPYRPFPSK